MVGLNKSQQRLHCEVREDATDERKRFLCYNKYVISKCRKAKNKNHINGVNEPVNYTSVCLTAKFALLSWPEHQPTANITSNI